MLTGDRISVNLNEGQSIILTFSNWSFSNSHCVANIIPKARFHVAVRTQINKFVFYFIVRRNVKFGCSEC